MTYSQDFRRKVLAIKEDEQLSFSEVAERFKVSRDTVFRWSKNIIAKTKRNKPATKIDMELLKLDVMQYPDAYLYERAKRLQVSRNCVYFALRRLKVVYKKNSKSSQGMSRKTLCFLPAN